MIPIMKKKKEIFQIEDIIDMVVKHLNYGETTQLIAGDTDKVVHRALFMKSEYNNDFYCKVSSTTYPFFSRHSRVEGIGMIIDSADEKI